jgi:hypothetical protein
MRSLGITVLLFGLAIALYSLGMDTTVASGYDRVNNLGLMRDQQNFLIVGVATVLVGVMLFGFSLRSKQSASAEFISDGEVRPCPFCAELVKNQAIKCRHCGSDIPQIAETQTARAVGNFFEKPDGMSMGEYRDELLKRYNVKAESDGYSYGGKRLNSLSELIDTLKAEAA